MIKINNFLGDLSSISAKTATLLTSFFVFAVLLVRSPGTVCICIVQNTICRINISQK